MHCLSVNYSSKWLICTISFNSYNCSYAHWDWLSLTMTLFSEDTGLVGGCPWCSECSLWDKPYTNCLDITNRPRTSNFIKETAVHAFGDHIRTCGKNHLPAFLYFPTWIDQLPFCESKGPPESFYLTLYAYSFQLLKNNFPDSTFFL